jgi:Ca-activated chloride channel homolog
MHLLRARLMTVCLGFLMLMPSWGFASPSPLSLAEIHHGSLLINSDQPGRYHALPTQDSRVRINVTGPIARAVVTQRFTNPGDTWMEALYAFPLPEDAAVDRLRLRIGERIVEGEIQEKQAARRTYEAAREQGQRAALVEQRRPNLFTTAVANIPPNGEVQVEIEYQQTLRWRDEQFSLRFPMAVTPRYTPAAMQQQMEMGEGWALLPGELPNRAEPATNDNGTLQNPVDLEITLAPGFALGEVKSHYHVVEQSTGSPGTQRIRLAADAHQANRDFVLSWTAAPGRQPQAAFFTEQVGDAHYGLLMLMPPTQDAPELPRPPREVQFIVDVSGSMSGERIRAAKAALVLALDTLDVGDHFNIVTFNHEAKTLWSQARPADVAHRNEARRFIQRLDADGGTDMLPALQRAFAQAASDSRALSQFVFITDGAVGNEHEVLQLIERKLGRTRLFTVGIGQAPNDHFMTEAARAGRGTFVSIAEEQDVGARMGELFAKIESPALTDLRFKLPVGADVLPNPIPDLYRGEPLVVAMKLDAVPHRATLTGRRGERDIEIDLGLTVTGESAGLSVLWARQKIQHWSRAEWRGEDADTVRRKILDLALSHHLVSDYTSLVAVDRTPARPADAELNAHALASNRPGDMQQVADSLVMASTSTDSFRALLASLGLMLLAACCFVPRREVAA